MNKTKIDWCDYTWNPIVGCKNGCWYCYAKKIFERFHPGQDFKEIHIYQERIKEPMKVKKPARIFVGSMTDMMDSRISIETIRMIFETIWKCPQHTFIFLTKNNSAYSKIEDWPDNCWLGITITGTEWDLFNRGTIQYLLDSKAKVKFINFEPLLGTEVYKLIRPGIDWIIIGGLTGPAAKENRPRTIEIASILERAAKYGIPVFIKDNLEWWKKIQNYPVCT